MSTLAPARRGRRLVTGAVTGLVVASGLAVGTPEASAQGSKERGGESVYMKAISSARRAESSPPKTYTNEDLGPTGGATKTWTNADLERRFGSDEDAAPSTEAATPEAATAAEPEAGTVLDDPLKWLEERQRAEADRRARIAQAQADLDAAKRNLANLERQLLATRNPFSARPQLADEERELRRTSGETAAERHRRTQELVDKAREEVAAAEARLQQLRAQ